MQTPYLVQFGLTGYNVVPQKLNKLI